MNTEKINLPANSTYNAINYGSQKETINTLVLVVYHKERNELHTPITAKFYSSRRKDAMVVSCSVWIRPYKSTLLFAGYGQTGGYGYHKESEAFDKAVRSAGITGYLPVGGCGEEAVKDLMLRIASACGWDVATAIIV